MVLYLNMSIFVVSLGAPIFILSYALFHIMLSLSALHNMVVEDHIIEDKLPSV